MRRTATILLILVTLAIATGCQKALFPKDEPRSQFEMHERLRGGFTPMEVPDVFGNPQPALRARLSDPQ